MLGKYNVGSGARWNSVAVTKQNTGYSQSVAGLFTGDTYEVANFKGSSRKLIIEACADIEGDADTPWTIVLSIGLGKSVCDEYDPDAGSMAARTPEPTRAPVGATLFPTAADERDQNTQQEEPEPEDEEPEPEEQVDQGAQGEADADTTYGASHFWDYISSVYGRSRRQSRGFSPPPQQGGDAPAGV